MLNILRLTIGIGLLMTLVTACQSNLQPGQNQPGQNQSDQNQTNPGQANPNQPVPGFNLSLEATSLNLTQGDVADVTVKLERLNGFAQAVTTDSRTCPPMSRPAPRLWSSPPVPRAARCA